MSSKQPKMHTTLENKDLREVVNEEISEQANKPLETPRAEEAKEAANLRALEIKDHAVLHIIQHDVAHAIFEKILSTTTPKQASDLPEYSYQGNVKVNMG